LAGDAFDDLAGEERAHTLVGESGAGFVEKRGLQGARDELAERGVGAAELRIFGEHVGQAGGVGEEVADADEGPVVAAKFGEVVSGGVIEGDEAALDEDHEADGVDGLGDGSEKVDGVGRGAEAFVEHDAAVAEDDDGCGLYAAGAYFLGEQLRGDAQSLLIHADRFGFGALELSHGGESGAEG